MLKLVFFKNLIVKKVGRLCKNLQYPDEKDLHKGYIFFYYTELLYIKRLTSIIGVLDSNLWVSI